VQRALVWFKRDLRVADHAPLVAAAQAPSALALFILEPAWLHSAECHPRHGAHLLQCLDELQAELAWRGLALRLRVGEAVSVLAALQREFAFTHLLSHEETGPGWSYQRDLAVARWCREEGVAWQEWPQTGVVRRLRDRRGWAGRWLQRMNAPPCAAPLRFAGPVAGAAGAESLPSPPPAAQQLAAAAQAAPAHAARVRAALAEAAHTTLCERAGEAEAWRTLRSFLEGRALGYRRHLSSPLSAERGCSRLSVHLAYGSLSMRSVHQATEAAIAACAADGQRELAYGLRGFASRLRWHCHFMQKLEDEPAIEFRNFARSHDGLRPGDGTHPEGVNAERLAAWCEGRTGFAMVDACMRQLNATGWLNFRMRAMLVSFAAYQLGLHWREPGLHLARQFLDFEPGIHWSQMQMQSGTTGINTLRIYSPRKQQTEQDPEGRYVRRWLPEFGTSDYPTPIVDEAQALAEIRARLYGLRTTTSARDEANAIQQRHGSRASGLPPSQRTPRSPPKARRKSSPAADDPHQGELF